MVVHSPVGSAAGSVLRPLTLGLCGVLLLLTIFAAWYALDWLVTLEAASRSQATGVLVMVALPLLLLVVAVALLAFNLSGRAGSRASPAQQGQALQNRLNYVEEMLKVIGDVRPGAVAMVDSEGRYNFVNKHAAQLLQREPDEIVGKDVEKVLGEKAGIKLKLQLQQVRMMGTPESFVELSSNGFGNQYVRTQLLPLAGSGNVAGTVLVCQDDVTPLMVERERRERSFRQLIDTLVAVVDRRDPYAAGHSARVGQVARAIAEEMDLPTTEIETAEIAGLLMNFGKVLVPRSILTKTTPLSPEELKQVRDSIMTSADILSLIGFEQPVVPALRQVLERYDGTGLPEGRKGDQIILPARIVTVANAFVAIVSARAHRPGLPTRGALEQLQQQSGKVFDSRVVIALANYIENRRDKPDWLAQGAV